ncbi:hypothetical protein KKI22_00710 [Patescibacteria group bacterium]|nr:hypothetical protein [Patescibacteria group bacterium]
MKQANISLTVARLDGRTIQVIRSRKTKRIFNFIQRKEFSDCLFKVSVTYSNGLKNETNKQAKETVMKTLKIFLEKD